VDFKVSCSKIPRRAFEKETIWLRVRRPNHSATTLHSGLAFTQIVMIVSLPSSNSKVRSNDQIFDSLTVTFAVNCQQKMSSKKMFNLNVCQKSLLSQGIKSLRSSVKKTDPLLFLIAYKYRGKCLQWHTCSQDFFLT
jgi:hypothetical protein